MTYTVHIDTVVTGRNTLAESVIEIGSRLELFVDDYLIDTLSGATRTMNKPSPQNVVMEFDKPWEGNSCNNFTVFKDEDIYRMYYRGSQVDYIKYDHSRRGAMTGLHTVVCYAESTDGINWEKPSLGLVEFDGSTLSLIHI